MNDASGERCDELLLKGRPVRVSPHLADGQAYEFAGTWLMNQKMYDALKDTLAGTGSAPRRPRTTQEAMLAAIASDPADDTARLAYADWCDEFDRPQEACEQRLAACLRRVIAEPDDDAPRLEYADVCERYGRKGRAELIRVQVERDRIPSSRQGNTRAQRRRRAKLWERERELWDAPGAVPIPDGVGSVQTLWRRGFIEAVEVTAETWLAHGDAIAAKHPVREVALTTIPIGFQEGDHFILDGDPKREHIPLAVADAIYPPDTIQHVCIRYRFPGIAFTLPPPARPVNTYIGTDADAGNPANWSLGSLPADGDHVVIPAGATVGNLWLG